MNSPEAHFGRLPMRFRTRCQSPMDRAAQDTMTIAFNDSLTEATPQPRPEPHSARFNQDPTNQAKERYPVKN